MCRRFKEKQNMGRLIVLLSLIFILIAEAGFAQNDTTTSTSVVDSLAVFSEKALDNIAPVTATDTTKKKTNVRTAPILSAILPGAGQVYNRKYWKVPLVYGALAIPSYLFVDNLRWFERTRYAFNVLSLNDTANYKNVHPLLQPLIERGDRSGLQNFRDEFRRNVDYSFLAFLLLWGLNIMDASVDAHLKDFNITDDLSLQIKPGYLPVSNTVGIGLVFNIGKNRPVGYSYSR